MRADATVSDFSSEYADSWKTAEFKYIGSDGKRHNFRLEDYLCVH